MREIKEPLVSFYAEQNLEKPDEPYIVFDFMGEDGECVKVRYRDIDVLAMSGATYQQATAMLDLALEADDPYAYLIVHMPEDTSNDEITIDDLESGNYNPEI